MNCAAIVPKVLTGLAIAISRQAGRIDLKRLSQDLVIRGFLLTG
jgi:hypothetical protein